MGTVAKTKAGAGAGAEGRQAIISTWANKPALGSLKPYVDRVMITDLVPGGGEWYSDGEQWRVVGDGNLDPSTVFLKANALSELDTAQKKLDARTNLGVDITAGFLKANALSELDTAQKKLDARTNLGAAKATAAACSWVDKPDMSTLVPYTDKVFITDVGVGGSEWFVGYMTDGITRRWRPVGGQVILAAKSAATISLALPATGEGATFGGYTAQAGVISILDEVVINATLMCTTTTTNSPNIKFKVAGGVAGYIDNGNHGTSLSSTSTTTSQTTIMLGAKIQSASVGRGIFVGASHGFGAGGTNTNAANFTLAADPSSNPTQLDLVMNANGLSSITYELVNYSITLKTCG